MEQIQELTPPNVWNHITLQQNPANCDSHRVLQELFVQNPLWWSGLEWMMKGCNEGLKSKFTLFTTLPYFKTNFCATLTINTHKPCSLCLQSSYWSTIQHYGSLPTVYQEVQTIQQNIKSLILTKLKV